MSSKVYTIEFYSGAVQAGTNILKLSSVFDDLYQNGCPVISMYNIQFEIRNLQQHGNGSSYTGELAKFREDDIPHAGFPGGTEHEIDLDEGEGLIEKNYFSFHKENNLLVFQRNRNGAGAGRLGEYLSTHANETVVFNPVLQLEPMKRLLKGEVIPRSLEVSFARPTNLDLFPGDQWNSSLLSVLTGTGGARMKVEITSDIRSKYKDFKYLKKNIKASLRKLVDAEGVSVARLNVEEDGLVYPIDLIADRVLSKQDVTMQGRYPLPSSMLKSLRDARIEKKELIKEYFGVQETID